LITFKPSPHDTELIGLPFILCWQSAASQWASATRMWAAT